MHRFIPRQRWPLKGKYESTLSTYLTGPFLLDPFYRAAAYDEHFGVFRLADLAPASFRMSEYYKNWYRTCGYEDECGLLIKLSKDNFLNISIGLTDEGARFKKKHAKALSDVYAITSALCRKHFDDILKAKAPSSSTTDCCLRYSSSAFENVKFVTASRTLPTPAKTP